MHYALLYAYNSACNKALLLCKVVIVNKFILVLVVAMFLVTTFLLVNMAAVGQAPLAMYLFFGGIGYCVALAPIIMTSFVE